MAPRYALIDTLLLYKATARHLILPPIGLVAAAKLAVVGLCLLSNQVGGKRAAKNCLTRPRGILCMFLWLFWYCGCLFVMSVKHHIDHQSSECLHLLVFGCHKS
ncbi:hypothetical protein GE09DRAFT_1127953 [Coniochaeta sp. 2T2.1]|nr:hypothetical protein GE09DRAFT_1127953 [Coniochaeta sp. 2T2.1]